MNEWVRVERQLTGVWVRPEFIAIIGSSQAGVLLSQIVYWFKPGLAGTSKLRVKRKGILWLAKRRADWARECGLSPRQYDTAIAKLIKLEVVETKIFHFAGHPTVHLRLLEPGLERLKSQIGDSHITEVGNPNHESVIPYTETTYRDYDREQADAASAAEEKEPVGLVPKAMPHKHVEEAPRAIADWMAERPVLAEQKAGRFTAGEWLMKASDILKNCQTQMGLREVRLTTNSLAMAWKRTVAEKYGGFVKELTQKEVGQLKMYLQKLGEQAPEVMAIVLDHWGDFVLETKYLKGLSSTPERPVIGFLLQYYDIAMNMYLQSIAHPEPEPIDGTVCDKAVINVHPPKPKEDIATLEDVMAALAKY